MKYCCDRCGKEIGISIKERIRGMVFSSKIECEQCRLITAYEKREIYNEKYGTVNEKCCEIGKFERSYYDWIEKNKNQRCVVRKTDGTFEVAVIKGIRAGQIELYSEERGCGYRLPIFEIDRVEKIKSDDRRYIRPDDSFIIGYKGIALEDGILGEDVIYEINIPYREKYRDPFMTEYQETYLHFCMSMEDVLYWRDYISLSLANKIGGHHYKEYRLFRVKAEGHYFRNGECDWVSNCLTVLNEVKQPEIIKYFEENEERKRRLKDALAYQNAAEDAWEKYISHMIDDYRNDLSDSDALRICVEGSPLYGTDSICNAEKDVTACNGCDRRRFCFGNIYTYGHYCYLCIRNKIKRDEDYMDSAEYGYLVENNRKRELQAVSRLEQFYKESRR